MDINKQPGIKCDSIILSESFFKRKPQIPKDLEIQINFDVKNTINEERKKLASEVTAIINNEESAVYAKVTYVGLFSIQGEENLPLNEFAESNAPAIIFPYIREEIHNKMQKACLPKFLIIPPINIIALSKSSDSK